MQAAWNPQAPPGPAPADLRSLDQTILDSMGTAIVVLDELGTIIAVNTAWCRLGLSNGIAPLVLHDQIGLGVNYLDACQPGAPDTRRRIQAVLDGDCPEFTLVYQCDSPAARRWFSMQVTPLGPDRLGAVIAHTDITDRIHAESALREEKRQVQALSQRLLRLQEAERRSVAQELHEGLAQALTILKLNLQAAQVSGTQTHLADNLAIVEDSLVQIRRLALALRPAMLDVLGLAPALDWLTKQTAEWAGFVVHYRDELPDLRFAPSIETVYFRIAQEALTNVIRHADARNVHVHVGREAGRLLLSISDDGCGFEVDSLSAVPATSLGLLDMQERATLIGAELRLESSPGQGSTVTVRCTCDPLRQP